MNNDSLTINSSIDSGFVPNILDIQMDIVGGITISDHVFNVNQLDPKLGEYNIMITYLFKYTPELFKKTGVPLKYTSFLEKKNVSKRDNTRYLSSRSDTTKKRYKGSNFFYKLVKYAAKNGKLAKIGSKKAIENINENIKFILKILFKPKSKIYINKKLYLIHKIDKGLNIKFTCDGCQEKYNNYIGEYERINFTLHNKPVFKHAMYNSYIFYYNEQKDPKLTMAMSWYDNERYHNKYLPKIPDKDYIIFSAYNRQLNNYPLGLKYFRYKTNVGWIISDKIGSGQNINIKDFIEHQQHDNDLFSKSIENFPNSLLKWYDKTGLVSNAKIIKSEQPKLNWLNKSEISNIRPKSSIPLKIKLFVTSRNDPLKSFAKLDCEDKRKDLSKDFYKFLGWNNTKIKKGGTKKKYRKCKLKHRTRRK